jgi:hypothetical protein
MGNTRCYSTDPAIDASVCGKNITESDCSTSSAFTSGGGPIACFNWRAPTSVPLYSEYEKLSVKSASKAIEFVAYDNAECTGTPIGSVKPSEYETCKKFPRTVRGLAYKALWNADLS